MFLLTSIYSAKDQNIGDVTYEIEWEESLPSEDDHNSRLMLSKEHGVAKKKKKPDAVVCWRRPLSPEIIT